MKFWKKLIVLNWLRLMFVFLLSRISISSGLNKHCAAQCLLLHVKRIEILRFGGQNDEMELVKYLLKNGEGLNRMMIVFMNSATKKKLCQKLLRFERGSTTCEVQFLWDLCQEILCFLKLILGHICILFSPWSLY